MTGGLSEAIANVHEIGPLVASRAAEAEQLGHLTDDVIDGFHSTGLVRMLLPADLGGLDLTLPESVEVVRQLSTYDASAGWVLTTMVPRLTCGLRGGAGDGNRTRVLSLGS